jgi:DNA/RNA-binding domain of Phe-tRNA-synthetase-like protein
MTTTIHISRDIRSRHPDVVVRGLVVSGLRQAAPKLVIPPTTELAQRAQDLIGSADSIGANPIIQGWREAIGACHLKPSRYRSSVEALVRRVLAGQSISTPLPVVDLYCAISVLHLAPLGAYDRHRLPKAQVELRLADPTRDTFEPLGARADDMKLTPDVAIYAAGTTVLCYAYNHRDSVETCLVEDTDDALFVGEALTPPQVGALDRAIGELRARLDDAGAKITGTVGET